MSGFKKKKNDPKSKIDGIYDDADVDYSSMGFKPYSIVEDKIKIVDENEKWSFKEAVKNKIKNKKKETIKYKKDKYGLILAECPYGAKHCYITGQGEEDSLSAPVDVCSRCKYVMTTTKSLEK